MNNKATDSDHIPCVLIKVSNELPRENRIVDGE